MKKDKDIVNKTTCYISYINLRRRYPILLQMMTQDLIFKIWFIKKAHKYDEPFFIT